MSVFSEKTKVVVLGASGYTGGELMRLLLQHDKVEIAALTAARHAGEPVAQVFPHLAAYGLPDLVDIESVDFAETDAVFCALPHGTTQSVVAGLPAHLKVVDLSADFRLRDPETYAEWYGHAHEALGLQQEAVYGLTELYREQIAGARLVAVPGCYPTSALLPLLPLVKAGLVDPDEIIIDAKSGATGAGRALKEGSLFAEVAEGIHAYGIAKHRHSPEIEQELSAFASRPVTVNFTPHLMPMNRGILASIYVRLTGGTSSDDLREALAQQYEGEPFVKVLGAGAAPATRHVRGSNLCTMAVFAERRPGRAIIVSAIDNLVKGAAGQAVQNLNVMCGFDEAEGLRQVAMFP